MSLRRLYGIRSADTAASAAIVAEFLGCTLEQRESDYLGIYWIGRTGAGEVKVVHQPDPEGDNFEDDFPEFPTLIYVESESPLDSLAGRTLSVGVVEKLRDED